MRTMLLKVLTTRSTLSESGIKNFERSQFNYRLFVKVIFFKIIQST